MTTQQNTTPHNINTETDHDPETVEWNIRRFTRRIRFRAGIISGETYSHGHGTSPLGPEWYAEQQAALDSFTEQLAYWENIRDHQAKHPQTDGLQ
jgi:hypothetical protein